MARIAILEGHPDAAAGHFGRAPAESYAKGAAEAGHEVMWIDVSTLDFPHLRTRDEWHSGVFPDAIRRAQDTFKWAEHLVILYPLWLCAMPTLLKGFLEQVVRPGFAIEIEPDGAWKKLLTDRSARIVVTMGMPAFIYRWYFCAHSLKSLERNILWFVGIAPVLGTIIGSIETCGDERRRKWLDGLRVLGHKAR